MSRSTTIRGDATMVLVLIASLTGLATANAQRLRQVTVPADTVVQLRLDTELSSRQAREGDLFASVLADNDRSGFPVGTRFQGVIEEVQRRTHDKPGMLDVRIIRAYFPDGAKVALSGRLASLADDDVRGMDDGRLKARKRAGDKANMDWKWAGYGAGAGAVLSAVLGEDLLKGVLLGGAGGAIYGYLNRNDKDRDTYRDVELPVGSEFGMRLERSVVFDSRTGYRYAISQDDSEYSPDRQQSRIRDRRFRNDSAQRFSETTVWLDGRSVALDEPAISLNGIVYVPLEPIAQAANMRYIHRPGRESFSLAMADGVAQSIAGEGQVSLASNSVMTLTEEPVSINGTIYVSPEFLSRVAGFMVRWDPAALRLELQQTQ